MHAIHRRHLDKFAPFWERLDLNTATTYIVMLKKNSVQTIYFCSNHKDRITIKVCPGRDASSQYLHFFFFYLFVLSYVSLQLGWMPRRDIVVECSRCSPDTYLLLIAPIKSWNVKWYGEQMHLWRAFSVYFQILLFFNHFHCEELIAVTVSWGAC